MIIKVCEMCRRRYKAANSRFKFCPQCKEKRKRDAINIHFERNPKTVGYCAGCGISFYTSGMLCPRCKDKFNKALKEGKIKECSCCGRRLVFPGLNMLCRVCFKTDGNPDELAEGMRSKYERIDPESEYFKEVEDSF